MEERERERERERAAGMIPKDPVSESAFCPNPSGHNRSTHRASTLRAPALYPFMIQAEHEKEEKKISIFIDGERRVWRFLCLSKYSYQHWYNTSMIQDINTHKFTLHHRRKKKKK
ncbi:unnamed protein product [Tuber aestivum]|uniref:Uncharacterized protein n=1 Tax=Tuber aestivum TaxID=59557 RepID=A0A292PN72_9PEZI|nr:unnamed protein product [Tuber aestivum]